MALSGVRRAVALYAHQQVVLGGKGSIDERSAARAAQETLAVPVAVLVGQILHRPRPLKSHSSIVFWGQIFFQVLFKTRDKFSRFLYYEVY